MGEWVQYLQETLTTPVSLVIVGAGFFGLLIGWLVGRPVSVKKTADESATDGSEELQWRHEKLVLLERQEVERECRLERFLSEMAVSHGGSATEVRTRLFALAEGIRSMRGRVGSDLSRFSLVKERLHFLKEKGAARAEALDACMEMSDSQIERLRSMRESLRPIGEEILKMERDLSGGQVLIRDERESLLIRAEAVRNQLAESSASWSILADETDKGIRDLLAAGQEPEYEPLRQILLVDGAATGSLQKAPSESLMDEADELFRALRGLAEEPVTSKESVEDRAEDMNGHLAIEGGFQSIAMPGFVAEDLPKESVPEDELEPVAEEEPVTDDNFEGDPLVLFRSNDVELWGQSVYRGMNCRARSLTEFPDWAKWISIQRHDTGERVFSRIDAEVFAHGGNGDVAGFNASNELFYGARHLGMFSENCPNEIETRFTYGGWGFGHRVNDLSEGEDSLQASGWEGKEIAPDTVFEIVLYAELPELESNDQVLES